MGVGRRIKRLREETNYSLKEMAKASKIPLLSLKQIEDEIIYPSKNELIALAHLLNICPFYLLRPLPSFHIKYREVRTFQSWISRLVY